MTGLPPFRIGFVPGVTLTKWSGVWADRHRDRPLDVFAVDPGDPVAPLRDGSAAVVFARLPIDGGDLHSIELYDEQPVVVLPKGHDLADLTSLVSADLDGETRFDLDPSLDAAMQIEVVVTGAGVAVMPQSLARLHGRKGITVRPVTDLPPTTIALVWPTAGAETDADVDDFIGIVRGRTANSSRVQRNDDDAPQLGPVAKAKAKRAAAAAEAEKTAAKKPAKPKRAAARSPQRGRGGPAKKGRR